MIGLGAAHHASRLRLRPWHGRDSGDQDEAGFWQQRPLSLPLFLGIHHVYPEQHPGCASLDRGLLCCLGFLRGLRRVTEEGPESDQKAEEGL